MLYIWNRLRFYNKHNLLCEDCHISNGNYDDFIKKYALKYTFNLIVLKVIHLIKVWLHSAVTPKEPRLIMYSCSDKLFL